MKVIFISGTDTGVGKTVITGLLGRYLLDKGYRVVTQKWIQTGCVAPPNDIDIHLKFMGKDRRDFEIYYPAMAPYTFKFASSPHLAARLERRQVRVSNIIKALKVLSRDFDFVLIEGIGGLLVPLSSKILLIDLIDKLGLPVLLVAGNKLGSVNHALLSADVLKKRKINNLGIIFNNISKNTNGRILRDNPMIVKKINNESVLGALPWMRDIYRLRKKFIPIGEKIFERYEQMDRKRFKI